VCGGVGFATNDLPASNDKASMLAPSAGKFCRVCDEDSENIARNETKSHRLHHKILETRTEIQGLSTKELRDEKTTATGVKGDRSPFESLSFDLSIFLLTSIPILRLFFFLILLDSS
jgi:hypothetical protein